MFDVKADTAIPDLRFDVPYGFVNDFLHNFYHVLIDTYHDIHVNKTVDVVKGPVTANFTVSYVDSISLDYSSTKLLEMPNPPEANVVLLNLNKIGAKVEFNFTANLGGEESGTFELKGFTQQVKLQIVTEGDKKMLHVTLPPCTIDDLIVTFTYKPFEVAWDIAFLTHWARETFVNSIVSDVQEKYNAKPIQINELHEKSLMGIDVKAQVPDMAFTTVGTPGEGLIRFSANTDFSIKGQAPAVLYKPNMTVQPTDVKNTHLFVNSNMVNKLLWTAFNSGLGKLLVSQATMDKLGIHLLDLNSESLILVFPNI